MIHNNDSDILRCIREYVDHGGRHRFLVGEKFEILERSISYAGIDVEGKGIVLVEWCYVETYFLPLSEYRNKIINELLS